MYKRQAQQGVGNRLDTDTFLPIIQGDTVSVDVVTALMHQPQMCIRDRSDEIVEAFLLDKRAEAARDRKMFRYKAFYSDVYKRQSHTSKIYSITLVWLYAVRALFCPYGAGTSGQHGPNFIPCLLYTS